MAGYIKTKSVLDHVENTLDIIAYSGLNDFVEGGFYRYTVDRRVEDTTL